MKRDSCALKKVHTSTYKQMDNVELLLSPVLLENSDG